MDPLQRRFDELLSVLAILGPDHCTVEALDPPELFAAVLQGEFDCSSCQHLAEQPTQLTLLLHPPGVPPARLHLRLPPAYPGSAAAAVTAVTCDGLGRQWEQRALQQLQAVAGEAPDECLYQLTDALTALLQPGEQAAGGQLGCPLHEHDQPAAAQQAQQQHTQQQAQQAEEPQQHPGADAGRQLALLKLDHMHSRPSYSRLIRRWAGELGLEGRLLFCGSSPIILILLLGAAGAIKEFLLRMRTRNVDVDSKGRPCRERMMTVLAVVNHSAGSSAAHNHSSSSMAGACPGGAGPGAGNGSCTAGACGGTRHCGGQAQLFDTFLEEDVNVAQLAAYLCAAGLLQHWAAATGLPPPS